LDVNGFSGREDELAYLDSTFADGAAQSTAVIICAVTGTAGVGKTALAVHWAHRNHARFPDGQLYVNLCGFDPAGPALDPAEVIRRFLDAFGVPPDRIPTGLDARAALYRSLLRNRRMLLVLDNARDAEQVRPLLPGAPSCLVIVTSRNQLTSLVATQGAHPLSVDLLTTADARDLLVLRLGFERLAADPSAVGEIIHRCARLPLALAIVASRAATHPGFALGALAEELRAVSRSLDALGGPDNATDMRTVFSWSYDALSATAATLFRRLAIHPGPDIAVSAAASLVGMSRVSTRPLLAQLANANLITEHAPGRYTFHDLLRSYATELAHTIESANSRYTASRRMHDHYLHTAYAASRLLSPHRDPIELTSRHPGVTVDKLVGREQALAWFTAEHPALLSLIGHEAWAFDTHTWQLAWAVGDFLRWRGLWHEWAAAQRPALAAARRLASPIGEAHAHRGLASAYAQMGRLDDAQIHDREALRIFGEMNDHAGQALVHLDIALIFERRSGYCEALSHAEQALRLYEIADHTAGQARALNFIGWDHAKLGALEQSVMYCRRALALLQEGGDRNGEADTWDSLGYAHHRLGDHAQAVTCFQEAILLYQLDDDRYGQAETFIRLGDTHHEVDNPEERDNAWWSALRILDEIGHPGAAGVRARLQKFRHSTDSLQAAS